MKLPYGKIAIYVLTFIGYIYSGYGSGVIRSLRDAVLSAELIFGDVFKNFITVSQKFKTVHEIFDSAIEETCAYECPGNAHPSKNKLHVPSSDGCGSLGVNIDTDYLPAPEMAKCCEAHDICYDTCNSDKELCDLDFKRCLYKYCDSFEKGPAGDVLIKGCKAASKVLFTGTMTLGCKSYLDAQERACFCPPVNPNSNNGNNNNQRPPKQEKYDKYDKSKNNGKKQQKDKRNFGWKANDEV